MNPAPALLTVGFYAGLNGLLLFWLAAHVGLTRRRLRIPMGDTGNPMMIRAMRGQANFVEYVPFCLILMGVMAVLGAPVWEMHLMGLALTFGRLLHAWHFIQDDAPGWQRAAGIALTMAVLLAGSGLLIAHAAVRMV